MGRLRTYPRFLRVGATLAVARQNKVRFCTVPGAMEIGILRATARVAPTRVFLTVREIDIFHFQNKTQSHKRERRREKCGIMRKLWS